MTPIDRELLTDLLHACYDAAPQPLYPAQFAQDNGIDRATLDRALDDLRLRGLVRLTDWMQGLGQGYTLTQAGADAIENRRGLKPGAPLPRAPVHNPEPYAEPRRATPLLRRGQPVVCWLLLIANIAIFLLTESASGPGNSLGRRLVMRGELTSTAVMDQHQWWRLLSYAFLHGGVLHIFCNMYFLYIIGPYVEAMWGSARMLLLYLVAAVTGGCVVVWVHPIDPETLRDIPTVGASGALCGLLASLGIWVMLNREHLAPPVAAALQRSVTINLILIGVMSFAIPNVSWEGHLGGALGGALASFPLQWSRYGETWWQRGLGFGGTLLVAAFFVTLMFARGWGSQPQF
jgi:membrane associated rhomboid family serine protease